MKAAGALADSGSTVTTNKADGGTGAPGFSDGKGQGGGAYLTTNADACIDPTTSITGNNASTSDNDVSGTFNTNC